MRLFEKNWPFVIMSIFIVAVMLLTPFAIASAQTPSGKATLNVVELRSIATEVSFPEVSADKVADSYPGLGAFLVSKGALPYGYQKGILFVTSVPLPADTIITFHYVLPSRDGQQMPTNQIGAWQFGNEFPANVIFSVWDGGFAGPWPSGITIFEIYAHVPDGKVYRSFVNVPVYIDDMAQTPAIVGFEQTDRVITITGKFDQTQQIYVFLDLMPIRTTRIAADKIKIDVADERLTWLPTGEHSLTIQQGETSASRTVYFRRIQQ